MNVDRQIYSFLGAFLVRKNWALPFCTRIESWRLLCQRSLVKCAETGHVLTALTEARDIACGEAGLLWRKLW